MARINIEDSLLKDDKFTELCIKLGSRIQALGVVTESFILAQKYYMNEVNDRLIPLNEWHRKKELHVLLDVEMAEQFENGVYIKGSEESFSWLLQKQAAGKKSADLKRIKREMASTSVERGSTEFNVHQPPTLTLTPTLSSFSNSNSSSDSNNLKKPRKPKKQETDEQKALNLKIWESYKTAYFNRWSVEAVKNEKTNSQISQLGKRLGSEAIEVVKFYVTHNDSFYLKTQHPIGLCLRDAEGLRTQMLRGKPITSNDVRNFEKQQNYFELKKAIRDGENF